jgi:hypothetical protein
MSATLEMNGFDTAIMMASAVSMTPRSSACLAYSLAATVW